ncbi:3-oxoacyl-ACP synthase [Neisseria meningitidis]|nr:3-oxoacyl-ACP synthase [Neisseria meningitidis]CKK02283.1 3-oxoacyl-ACP synthase [Neisseria meningitidis]
MDWHERFPELEAQLGAPIENYAPPKHWTRKQLRSMGRVSYLCVDAAEQALTDAGLLGDESITDGRMGVACGSSSGSTKDIGDVGELLLTGMSRNFSANTYVRMMPHTAAANIGIFFGLKGRIIPTSSACSSGSQGIGYAYEAIKYGLTDMMLAGGAKNFSRPKCMFSTRFMPPAAATANRKKPRAHTTRTATGWSSAKARGFSCWKNWNTPNGAVR